MLPHSREDTWDRGASVLGFWAWLRIGWHGSSRKQMPRGPGCESGSSAAGSAGINAQAVDDGRGACGTPRNGRGRTCRGRSTPSRWSMRSVASGAAPVAFARSGWGLPTTTRAPRAGCAKSLVWIAMPTSHAAVRHGISWGKARRAERAFLKEWDATRSKRRPRHLGADEIQRGKGQRFWTVLTDLVRGEVIRLGQDRTEGALTGVGA